MSELGREGKESGEKVREGRGVGGRGSKEFNGKAGGGGKGGKREWRVIKGLSLGLVILKA